MNPQEITKLADVTDHNLDGWEIGIVYFLQLEHTLMGSFPALRSSDREPILVRDKALLQRVWGKLHKRSAKVSQQLSLIHTNTGVAFNLNAHTHDQMEIEPLHVFSAEEIEEMCEAENVQWAPGLIGGSSHIREPNFD